MALHRKPESDLLMGFLEYVLSVASCKKLPPFSQNIAKFSEGFPPGDPDYHVGRSLVFLAREHKNIPEVFFFGKQCRIPMKYSRPRLNGVLLCAVLTNHFTPRVNAVFRLDSVKYFRNAFPQNKVVPAVAIKVVPL